MMKYDVNSLYDLSKLDFLLLQRVHIFSLNIRFFKLPDTWNRGKKDILWLKFEILVNGLSYV